MSIIYLEHNGELAPMRELPYDAEEVLQRLLAEHPDLIAGEDGTSRLMLIAREMGVPDEEKGSSRWSLDHLFVDDQGLPTLVEVKRNSDNRLRREVVGQMLDYAAQGAANWSSETIGTAFAATCEANCVSPDDALSMLGASAEFDEFMKRIETNLRAGRMRLLFVADQVPPELRLVVEFLNEHMTGVEVLAIEVRQYLESEGERRILVPTVIGSTEIARSVKSSANSRRRGLWTEPDLMVELEQWKPPYLGARLALLYRKLISVGARPSWGRGKHPSVTLWLGEDAGCPVSIGMYTNTTLPLAINFDFVKAQRGDEEMQRLAALARKLPGVAPYIVGLEEQDWGMHRGMELSEVLPDDGAVELWVAAIMEASSPG